MATERLDDAALEALYARLERRVYNVVYRWVWSEEDARDVVQEAFVRLWRMRGRVEMATVEPLVFRIAVNLASNKRRAKKLWGLVALDDDEASGHDVHADVAAAERQRRVRAAVDALPERLRRVVVLSELGGMSYREVAAALDIPEGTVGSRRNKALALLRERLSTDPEEAHAT